MSSSTATQVEDLDREELEAEVEELRERVDDLEQVGAVVAKLVNTLSDRDEVDGIGYTDPEFLPTAVAAFGDLADTVEEHDKDLKRIDSTVQESRSATGSTDDEHWWNVVEKAHNELAGFPEYDLRGDWVRLYREEIAKATGLSKKRGQQLIDEWTNEDSDRYKRGTDKQEYQRASAMNGHNERKKALKIDLGVWEVDDE
jgi:hypothetical protein